MECERARELIILALCNEVADAERHALDLHLAECANCQERWEEESALRARLALRAEPPPNPTLLADFRRRLETSLDESAPAAPARRGQWERLWFGWRQMGLAPALAALLVAAGFFAGWLTRARGAGGGLGTAVTDVLAAPALARVEAIQPASGGQIQVVFDAMERRVVAGSADSPQVQRLLIFAAQQPPNSGIRIDSIEALGGAAEDAQVRGTLLEVLARDPNPGVRLKALAALAPQVGEDAQVRAALVRTVLHDPNPGVRTEAISALSEAPREDAGVLLRQVGQQSDNLYVRLRCAALLRQLDFVPPPELLRALPAPQPENQ